MELEHSVQNEEINIYTKLITNFSRFKDKLNEYTEHTHEKINLFEFHIINNKIYIDTLKNRDKYHICKIIKSISFLIEAQLKIDKLYKEELYYIDTNQMLENIYDLYPDIFKNNDSMIL